ncbi:MAG: hypothetical protein GF419_11595 [Ignavibacteriales bacterium]|nr:hypothetical protein [Ignavibacteriales bacterium]
MRGRKALTTVAAIATMLATTAFADPPETPPASRAQGAFFGVNLGPRLPVGLFANQASIGGAMDLELSYTDTDFFPFFLYGRIGYRYFPGDQEYYQSTDHTHFSASYIPVQLGIRSFFEPITSEFFLLPVVEASGSAILYQELRQYDPLSGKADDNDEGIGYGFSIGVGASMYVLEAVVIYEFFNGNQAAGFDLRARIPLYVSL